MPHLPRETKVDVAKCHACPAKRRWMSACATPATRNEGGCHPSATPATQNEGGCRHVPRLPRETKVHVTKCHACHVKRRWMSPSATPATKVPRRHAASPVQQVPRLLPRKTKVDVAKCHACHAKRKWMSPSATPATQSAAASQATSGAQARHQSQPSAASATPATRNEGGCRHACHACHAKRRWMSPMPLLPRKAPRHHGRLTAQKTSATPATQNEGGCHQVPRLPRERKVDGV